ncbi:MAG: aminoglycoside nucleotidyltransferase [Sporomusaceae bacterium]|jgi:lincosamide nucleotidyltransferase A/C/D/E|nr:aminoglycoside nucleotidyltransferase [Sporomusaceae bacterium]
MMTEQDAVELLTAIKNSGIPVWLDGGWGIDALLGRQTRPHNDLDLFVETKNAVPFLELISSKGYREVRAEYTTAGHTCWHGPAERIIDLHLFEFQDQETLYFENEAYPAHLLKGHGTIGGIAVGCLTAAAQLLYHQGYEHTDKDVLDVRLLCETFGFDIPAEYQEEISTKK